MRGFTAAVRRLSQSVVVVAFAVGTIVGAQRPASPHPDLQGNWTIGTRTPLERPAELADRTHFTPEAGAEYERSYFDRARLNLPPDFRPVQVDLNDTWLDVATLDRLRTSLIVEPPNGRLPPLLPDAKARAAARPPFSYDGPESRPLLERCLLGNRGSGNSALSPPMIPSGLVSPYYQIVQTDDHVVIFTEWMHDARIVRLNGTHRPPAMKFWLGDSVGRWDGATLVVDTTNFRSETHNQDSGDRLHVVERFRRIDAETIQYLVTADDPDTWAMPWTAEIRLKATPARLFEFACHEGNYSMELSLRGARADERRAAMQRPK